MHQILKTVPSESHLFHLPKSYPNLAFDLSGGDKDGTDLRRSKIFVIGIFAYANCNIRILKGCFRFIYNGGLHAMQAFSV